MKTLRKSPAKPSVKLAVITASGVYLLRPAPLDPALAGFAAFAAFTGAAFFPAVFF